MRHQKIYRILYQRGWKETRSLRRKIIRIITTSHSGSAKADYLLAFQRAEQSVSQNLRGLPRFSATVVKMRT